MKYPALLSHLIGTFCVLLIATPLLAKVSPLPGLTAENGQLTTLEGKPITLRGVNLGGWLVEEIWMLPIENKPPQGTDFKPIEDHTSLWSTIEQRFGSDDMVKIRQAWRNNWVTLEDFKRIKSAGLNSVRIPFIYDSLDAPDGLFPWLDQAVRWARESGLYVILDLHGTPGRQSSEHHTGAKDVNRLFSDPANVIETLKVWKRIAARYGNIPEVAAFDLVNEPIGTPNESTLYLVQNLFYQTVRAAAPHRVIIIEDAYRGLKGMPYPGVVGWKNVLYSPHHYNFNAKSAEAQIKFLDDIMADMKKNQALFGVPLYVGEFNIEPHGTAAGMKRFIQRFDEAGLSWSIWTYKTAMRGGGGGMWGWYRGTKTTPRLDPYTDTVDQLLAKMPSYRTELLEVSAIGEALPIPAVAQVPLN